MTSHLIDRAKTFYSSALTDPAATGKRYAMEFVHWLRFTPDGRLQYMRELNDTAVIGEAFR